MLGKDKLSLIEAIFKIFTTHFGLIFVMQRNILENFLIPLQNTRIAKGTTTKKVRRQFTEP